MQTVLHCKNSNKEGHIHHLLPERESQEDGWMMTQELAEFKSPPPSSFCRCCQGGHTLCRLLPCHISHVPVIAALHLSFHVAAGVCPAKALEELNSCPVECAGPWGKNQLEVTFIVGSCPSNREKSISTGKLRLNQVVKRDFTREWPKWTFLLD